MNKLEKEDSCFNHGDGWEKAVKDHKKLNSKDSRGQKFTLLEEDGKSLTGKWTADHFVRTYKKEGNIHFSPFKQREA